MGDVLSGTGIEKGTKIVSIDSNAKTVTIDKPTIAIIALNSLITDTTALNNRAISSVANIDLAGRAVTFADTIDYTPGGTFTAIADNDSVTLASGSKLDISTGGGSAAGGNLVLKAPKQTVTLAGQIKANGGSAEFDVSTYSTVSSFDNLMAVINNAGIADSIYFRSRDEGIVQAATA